MEGSLRYIFTVTTGRSGQAALTDLLARHVPDGYAAFEEPAVQTHAPSFLKGWERRFRRRFMETHELLGRGRVLQAFVDGDNDYLEDIARRRQKIIERTMGTTGKSVYIDVSKFFARGLHRGWERILPRFSLIRLVRDPIMNMRSFLNRQKRFTLDNNLPNAAINEVKIDVDDLTPGELYLWSWCEMYLRFDSILQRHCVSHAVEIHTEELNNPDRMSAALDALELKHQRVVPALRLNTNEESGHDNTRPIQEDIDLFERFLDRLTPPVRQRIRYFDHYDPTALLRRSTSVS